MTVSDLTVRNGYEKQEVECAGRVARSAVSRPSTVGRSLVSIRRYAALDRRLLVSWVAGEARFGRIAIGCVLALLVRVSAEEASSKTLELPFEARGRPVVQEDFERCTPAHIIKIRDEATKEQKWLADGPAQDRAEGHWTLRHPGWTNTLINVAGTPPDLTHDPQLKGPHDIYLGLRTVDPYMSLGVKLSDEEEFSIITGPAATSEKHYDFEFHWRIGADLTDKQIIFRSVGRPIYLQHIRFVPVVSGTRRVRIVTDHVTICKVDGKHFAFPGVARLPNGDLGVVCREGIEHVCPFGRIVFLRSKDDGRTWSERVSICDTPSDERDPAILTLPDDRAAVTFNTWNSWMVSKQMREQYAEQTAVIERDGVRKYPGAKIMFTSDSGKTWTEPLKIPPFSPHGFAIAPNRALYYPATRNVGGRLYTVIYRSEDGGQSWVHHADVGAGTGGRGDAHEVVYREPHLAILPNGTWITTIRVQVHGHAVQSLSRDGGRRWSRPRKTKVKGFPQHVLPLKDGRLLMSYGYRYQPRGIRACLSTDGGKTWDVENEIVLRHEGANGDLGYPVSIELEDERVLTVYYYIQADGNCYIEGAFYKP